MIALAPIPGDRVAAAIIAGFASRVLYAVRSAIACIVASEAAIVTGFRYAGRC